MVFSWILSRGFCGVSGEGRWDALWGLLGMLMGAALYAEAYPKIKNSVLTWGDFGKITLPQILGINHWIIIGVFFIGGVALLRWFEKEGL